MNIDEFIENEVEVKSEFNGTILGISFTDQALFETVFSVTKAMLEKFKDISNIKTFVSALKIGINRTIREYETEKLKDYWVLGNIEVVSYKTIKTILLNEIKYADCLEDIKFRINDDDKPFNLINTLIENKKFINKELSKEQISIIEADGLFTVEEIKDWLNAKTVGSNNIETIKFYYNLINEQIKAKDKIWNQMST